MNRLSLKERIVEAVSLVLLGRGRERSGAPILDPITIGTPQEEIPISISDLSDAYNEIPAVYAGIFTIAHAFASVPLLVFRRGDPPKQVIDHPALSLLDPKFGTPNPLLSAYDLWEAHASVLELAGSSFWLLEGPGVKLGRPPSSIQILRPDLVRGIYAEDGSPIKYEYGPVGNARTYLPEEILPFKYFNPNSPIHGFPTILPAKSSILLDYWANEFNKAFFKNGAKLGPVIRFDEGTGINLVREAMTLFNEQHAGARNAHKAKGIVAAEISHPPATHEDMGFYQGLNYTTSRVLMALGVPPVLVTLLEGSHYENTEAQIRVFYEGTIIPKLRKRDAAINRLLMSRYGDETFVQFDRSALTALRQGLQEIRETARVYLDMEAMTPNEARAWLDSGEIPSLPPLEGGDEVREKRDPFEPMVEEEEAAGAPIRRMRRRNLAVERLISEVSEQGKKARKERLLSRASKAVRLRDERTKRHAAALTRFFRGYFSDQQSSLLAVMDKLISGPPARMTGGVDEIATILAAGREVKARGLERLLLAAIRIFGVAALKDLGGASDIAFNVISPRVIEYVKERAFAKLTQLDATTADRVRDAYRIALIEAQAAGDNSIATAERIMRTAIEDTYRNRIENASRVAQTETTAAYNFSEHESWRQSGVVQTKIWQTLQDDRVRDGEGGSFDHASMNGVEVAIDQPFQVPGPNGFEELMYPGDDAGSAGNVINCRCVLLPGRIQAAGDDGFNVSRSRIREISSPLFKENGDGR